MNNSTATTDQPNVFTVARRIGAKIIHTRTLEPATDGFKIVMATNDRGEHVTWLYANGGFHNGHYYGDSFVDCVLDFMKRA